MILEDKFLKKIEEIKEQGDMYDLAITDMQYPLKKVLESTKMPGKYLLVR